MADKPDKLILVLHGVGDPQPGDTVSLLTRSLADEERPLRALRDVVWLPEKSLDPDKKKTFESHVRELEYDGQTVEMAEVFWGDLSQIGRGIFGALAGLFQILFGLRYVAYIGADQRIPGASMLQRLGLISSRILHGPVLAVTFFLAFLTLAVCGTQVLWPDSYKHSSWSQLLVIGCAIVAFTMAIVGWKTTRSRVVERFWFWVQVTCAFGVAMALAKVMWLDKVVPELACETCATPGLIFYCRVFVLLLGLLWLCEMIVLVGMAFSWLISSMNPRSHSRGLYVAFLLPALAVGIWGHTLPMVWLAAKEALPVLSQLPEYSAVFDEAIPLLGVQFLMMLLLGSVAGAVFLRYLIWSRTGGVADFVDGKSPPRLLVNRVIQDTLLVASACGVFLVFLLGVTQMLGNNHHDFLLGRAMAEINKYAIVILVPMGGVLIFLLPHLRAVFDIMLDVVNHFYFRATNMQDALDDDDEFDIVETTFDSGSLYFFKRDQIQFRVKKILAYYRDRFNHRPELVIISHSQGTMVAIETLNDDDLDWIKNCFSSVTLVTMGSPFTHLYQHYFETQYPSLESPYWSKLRKRVDRWVNIFRVNDFVGTDIDFPTADFFGEERAADFSNHPVGPRGHVSYWNDCDVLEILREQLSRRPVHSEHAEQKNRAA